jgi:hypothetical protein
VFACFLYTQFPQTMIRDGLSFSHVDCWSWHTEEDSENEEDLVNEENKEKEEDEESEDEPEDGEKEADGNTKERRRT